tara:strand:+ start:2954 stop:3181 length:228 start_codon:yes stop_codon:yes gene_type:complete
MKLIHITLRDIPEENNYVILSKLTNPKPDSATDIMECAVYKKYLWGYLYIRVSSVFYGSDCWFKAIDLYHEKNNS